MFEYNFLNGINVLYENSKQKKHECWIHQCLNIPESWRFGKMGWTWIILSIWFNVFSYSIKNKSDWLSGEYETKKKGHQIQERILALNMKIIFRQFILWTTWKAAILAFSDEFYTSLISNVVNLCGLITTGRHAVSSSLRILWLIRNLDLKITMEYGNDGR